MSRVLRRLLRPFLILLALIFLFEAWLWSYLEPIVAWVVARIPVAGLKVSLTRMIERLPPAATLIVFIVPIAVLFPLKLLGLWLLGHGQWLPAVLVLVFAKLVGVGVTAFVFEVTRPKLLQMAWFRRFYRWVLWLLERAHALIDPVKRRLRTWLRVFAPRRAGRAFKLFRRIRRRMYAQPAA
jgi:hypothetical protein